MLKTIIGFMVVIGAVAASHAQTFTTVPFEGNFSLSGSGDTTGFPFGTETYLGGVPFYQTGDDGQVWNGAIAAGRGPGTVSLTLNLNISDATGFYSLINTWWGQDASQGSFASVGFTFSDDTRLTLNLSGNQDMRDFNNPGGFTTTINGTTTQAVYQNQTTSHYYMDRQWFDFSLYGDSGKTLTSVTFTDSGDDAFQRLLVSGATVQSGVEGQITGPVLNPGEVGSSGVVPEPSALALSVLGGAGLLLFRRKRI